jgi:hypothetical protein
MLDHLTPPAAIVASRSDAEREAFCTRDRFIGYTRALAALDQLEELFNAPPKLRTTHALVVSPSDGGKTTVLKAMCNRHPPRPDIAIEHIEILRFQVPPAPTMLRFYVAILKQLGVDMSAEKRLSVVEATALRLMERVGLRMLMVDEIHNINSSDAKSRRDILTLLRYLGNELSIPIVGAGTFEAHLALASDPQLENRFLPIPLPRWVVDIESRTLLASFAAHFPLRNESFIDTTDMATRIISRSEGTIGEISAFLTKAAVFAIRTKVEAITPAVLDACGYRGPTQRDEDLQRAVLT